MLHVLNLAYVLDPKLTPIHANPIPEVGKTTDPKVISDLEKQRALRRESDELCVDLRELLSALELRYKEHEEGTNKYLVSKYLEFQMGDEKPILEQLHELQVIVNKLNTLSIFLPEHFQVHVIFANLPPVEKHSKVRLSVHYMPAGGSNHKNHSGGQNKKNFIPKKQSYKKSEICARGWFVDIGSIGHVCGQRERFCTYHPILPGMVVICVDGHKAEVEGRGDVHLKLTRDVYHVPTILNGFVSVDKLDKYGFKMKLEKGKIVITKGRKYVGRVNNCSAMYLLYLC
uniref:Retrovirus-related Pol polyprotein from transposon TNT 1-94-like beta-barrel domain-containing protein n=1 Tax=Lactuca sativa TaxID=4236 RepID=A0A9R1VJU1_LACSA|nr:hypothetical protein LSAT_V11C400165760 [Lactuca sativa]